MRIDYSGTLAIATDIPMTHGSIGRFENKGLQLAFPAQLFDIVLELCILSGEDPGSGCEVVLMRLAPDHSARVKELVNKCTFL